MKRTLALAVAALVAVGCGKSEEQKAAEAAAKAAEQAAQGAQQAAQGAAQAAQGAQQGAQQMAQGLQQMTQGLQQMQGNATVVDFEKLEAMLPEVPGWTRSDVRGEQMTVPFKLSKAEARYTSGDSSVRLEITDTALAQMMLAPLTMYLASGYSERSSDGYKKSVTISGFPGFEEFTKGSKHGQVTAIVGNRFIVTADGDDVGSTEAPMKLVQAVDLTKLSTLK